MKTSVLLKLGWTYGADRTHLAVLHRYSLTRSNLTHSICPPSIRKTGVFTCFELIQNYVSSQALNTSPPPPLSQSIVVYEFPCPGYSSLYIGKTNRTLLVSKNMRSGTKKALYISIWAIVIRSNPYKAYTTYRLTSQAW